MILISFSIEKIIIPFSYCPVSIPLTFCTPIKCNLYLANPLAASAVSELALYMFLKFQVPNLMYLFFCLGHTKVSVRVRAFVYEYFITKFVLTGRSC